MTTIDNIMELVADNFAATEVGATDKLRAAIEQALGQGEPEKAEPVAYQYRMRPTWGSRGTNWGPWEECSKGKYDDCKKAPVVNDWEHESRALYTAPQPPAHREWVGLTDEQIEECFGFDWSGEYYKGWRAQAYNAIKAKLLEKNGGGA